MHREERCTFPLGPSSSPNALSCNPCPERPDPERAVAPRLRCTAVQTSPPHCPTPRRTFTVHGFRSSFRDWTAERTDIAREVAEMALAHAIRDKTEAAYRRGALLEKRRALTEKWAAYCGDGRL